MMESCTLLHSMLTMFAAVCTRSIRIVVIVYIDIYFEIRRLCHRYCIRNADRLGTSWTPNMVPQWFLRRRIQVGYWGRASRTSRNHWRAGMCSFVFPLAQVMLRGYWQRRRRGSSHLSRPGAVEWLSSGCCARSQHFNVRMETDKNMCSVIDIIPIGISTARPNKSTISTRDEFRE